MTTLAVEHGDLAEFEKLCACGCGTIMAPESKRAYIHGHRKAMEDGEIPDDPEPSDEAKAKTNIRITAKVRKEMEDSLEGYLAMVAGVWALSDPFCGPTLIDNSSAIAAKLTPILARNQMFVRYFRSSSTFRETMDLAIVLWPVVQMIGKHHIMHSIGQTQEDDGQVVNLNGFVA